VDPDHGDAENCDMGDGILVKFDFFWRESSNADLILARKFARGFNFGAKVST
jgi:hypothetical protein